MVKSLLTYSDLWVKELQSILSLTVLLSLQTEGHGLLIQAIKITHVHSNNWHQMELTHHKPSRSSSSLLHRFVLAAVYSCAIGIRRMLCTREGRNPLYEWSNGFIWQGVQEEHSQSTRRCCWRTCPSKCLKMAQRVPFTYPIRYHFSSKTQGFQPQKWLL